MIKYNVNDKSYFIVSHPMKLNSILQVEHISVENVLDHNY